MFEKTVGSPPIADHDQNRGEGKYLSDLDADVKCEQIRQQAIGRHRVFLDLRCEAESVKQPKDKRRDLGIRLNAKPALERPDIVEGLIDHGQTDDRIDQIAVDIRPEVNPKQHRRRMPDGKQTHVNTDVLQLIKKEDHPEQKQDVIVSRKHMLRPEINKRQQIDARNFLDVALIAFRNAMSKRGRAKHNNAQKRREQMSVSV